MFDEAVGSLFGVRQVAHYDAGDQRDTTRDCLFARRGVFERHCELVASVVATSSGFGFCVNELATDYRSFQSSAMYLRFASIHPPTSATDLTNNRGFFQISDFSVDRRDGHAVASYLEHAYGLPNAFMLDMKLHSASMLVPRRGATVTANNREQAPNEGTLPAAQKPGGR